MRSARSISAPSPPTMPSGPVPEALSAAFFGSVFDQTPRVGSLSWDALVARLLALPPAVPGVGKAQQPCWSPVALCAEGGGRAADVLAVTALVIDLDGAMLLDEALDRTEGWERLAHTTWSHHPERPRCRLVLPLARPVPAAAWRAVWLRAVEALDLPADPACKNANRRYLLPVQPEGGLVGQAIHRATGRALDLLPLASEPAGPRPLRPPLRVPPHRREAVADALLNREPEARRRLGLHLGGHLGGEGEAERIDGLRCPVCGRASVWFWVAPRQATRARCHHRKTCGWASRLAALAGAR